MRVMYFAFEGFDTPNGTNHLAIELIDFLLSSGIDVHLLSSHTKGVFPDIPPILENRKGFTYDIVQRSVVNKQNFIQRYLDGIKYAFRCKKVWVKKRDEIDLVILQSTPTAFVSSVLLKRYYKKPVLFNIFDVFPNVAYDTGALRSKLIYSVLLKMQRCVYKNSDKLIVISEDNRNNLIKQGLDEKKIVEIRNWYDDKTVRYIKEDENAFITKYDIPRDYFYVQYAGNFGYTFNYEYVLDVAQKLLDTPEVRFQMIGEGAFKNAFVEQAKSRNITNIDFYPWQPPEIIADVYSACTISIIPLTRGVIWNSFPSKGSLLMACGKVFICATEETSCYYKMINDNDVGICVSNANSDGAVEKIKYLLHHRERLHEIGEKARVFGQNNYSSSVNLPKFLELINEYDVCEKKE